MKTNPDPVVKFAQSESARSRTSSNGL